MRSTSRQWNFCPLINTANAVTQTSNSKVVLQLDSDTIACIAGGIAEAYYKTIPTIIIDNVINVLPDDLVNIIEAFQKYIENKG